MRAVHYLRVSDTKQIVGTSLETQENICNNFSSLQSYSVVDVVRHEGISAIRTKNQRIIELLDYCKNNKGKFDVLVVYKLDRFARSQEQHHWLRSELDKMGIILRSATENISEQGSGKLIEGVLAAVNEYDN